MKKSRRTAKWLSIFLAATMSLFLFFGCGTDETSTDDDTEQVTQSDGITYTNFSFSSEDDDDSWDEADSEIITFNGSTITYDGDGAEIDGTTITITDAGTYVFSGTLDDGQIVVDTPDSGIVKIVLNGVDLACSDNAAINIISSEKTVIVLAEGTENIVSDGETYDLDSDEDEPNAAIFSKSDLTINGSGSLIVNASYNDGIKSKDDLIITNGTITVYATADGIVGKDCLAIKNATITVEAGCDGMQATNDEDTSKGFLLIYSGTINIVAEEDGIQAETDLVVGGGTITIETGGGSANSVDDLTTNNRDSMGRFDSDQSSTDSDSDVTAKGLKAGDSITISGGTITIDSADDSIHSNDTITIDSGTISIDSGDDGIHADTELTINDGTITIAESYEGIESATITINGGTIDITSSDDGVNVAGGNDSSSTDGRSGQSNFNSSSSGDNWLYINGGTLLVNATGDGLDSNGSIAMTDGIVVISGPTSSADGALDYDGTFTMDGGFLVAAGSSGMLQTPSTSSDQYTISVTFSSTLSAGTFVHIESEDGEEILTFSPAKNYQNVTVCSASIESGETYIISTGGSASGDDLNGYYPDGNYSGGSEYTTLTVSSKVTSSGSYGGSGGGTQHQGR